MRFLIPVVLLMVVAVPTVRTEAGSRDAQKAFEAFGALAQDDVDDETRRKAFTKQGLVKERDVDGDATRRELLTHIAKAKSTKVREKGDEAVVRFESARDDGTVREVPMRRDGGEWKLDAPRSYVVDGPDLHGRTNQRTVKVTLTRRTDNKAYGTSAFCFAYATQDAADCKNRMDLWYCHNDDLHPSGGARIAAIGGKSLKRIDEIPVGVEWTDQSIAVQAGQSYVLHCRSSNRRDFYVKLRVAKKAKDAIQVEWSLLTTGLGAPESIHEPGKNESGDGPDGYDGLCGKKVK